MERGGRGGIEGEGEEGREEGTRREGREKRKRGVGEREGEEERGREGEKRKKGREGGRICPSLYMNNQIPLPSLLILYSLNIHSLKSQLLYKSETEEKGGRGERGGGGEGREGGEGEGRGGGVQTYQ